MVWSKSSRARWGIDTQARVGTRGRISSECANLVAFELKVRRFEPEDIGKLSFYVEALDRDLRKPRERPSIGVLLYEVVEYALARTTSPTLVAEYQTMLPPKAVLRQKLHELYAELASNRRN
jgi:hypothetical protein